ncbi:MAG: hypothetical protein KC708_22015 [Anaerolineae bacterium]|nr:hypothetical protein [Anaerolineae bacterium]
MQRQTPLFCTVCSILAILSLILVGCTAADNVPTPYATRTLSAPGIAPSPTIDLQTSEELYGEKSGYTGAVGQSDLTAASLPSRGVLPPAAAATSESSDSAATVNITLSDGSLWQGDLYAPLPGSIPETTGLVPGVLLVATDRIGWGLLPAQLQLGGLAALVVDAPNNSTDLVTVLSSFSEVNNVDPGLLAVITADTSIPVSLAACQASELCDALVLLSPMERDATQFEELNSLPKWVAAANTDGASYPVALSYTTSVANVTFSEYNTGQGTGLLSNDGVAEDIVTWLTETLKNQ